MVGPVYTPTNQEERFLLPRSLSSICYCLISWRQPFFLEWDRISSIILTCISQRASDIKHLSCTSWPFVFFDWVLNLGRSLIFWVLYIFQVLVLFLKSPTLKVSSVSGFLAVKTLLNLMWFYWLIFGSISYVIKVLFLPTESFYLHLHLKSFHLLADCFYYLLFYIFQFNKFSP